MIMQGDCARSIDAPHFNYWNFMPLPDDITHCTYANGVHVEMRRPLEQFFLSI